MVDGLVAEIERHAQWQQAELDRYNAGLAEFVGRTIRQRRERVLADREHLDAIGLPIRRADDAPTTYAAGAITRRAAPASPPRRPNAPAAPMEPELVGEFYEHLLSLCSAMARGTERTPGDYASWREEQLRDALLVLLGTHYEGQATGESFNRSGKTDILVRVEDRNVSVAECKWWSGPAAFARPGGSEPSALDQLLGYTTWRDAKLALVLFVSRRDMAAVIRGARAALAEHPAFERWTDGADEGQLRCRVRMPSSQERRADLSVVFVHLPRT